MSSDNKIVVIRHERPNSNFFVHSWTRMKSRCPSWNDKLEWRREQLMMRLKKDCRWSPAAPPQQPRPPRTRSQEEWAKILRSRQYWSNLPLTSPILRNRRAPSCLNGSTNTWFLGSTSWTASVIGPSYFKTTFYVPTYILFTFAGDGVIDHEEFEYVLSEFGVSERMARQAFNMVTQVSLHSFVSSTKTWKCL